MNDPVIWLSGDLKLINRRDPWLMMHEPDVVQDPSETSRILYPHDAMHCMTYGINEKAAAYLFLDLFALFRFSVCCPAEASNFRLA